MFLTWSMFTYNLTELQLIPKMLTTMLINWAVNSWHPYRENRLGWLHTRHRAVNQEVNFYFRRKRKTAISPPIFSLFQFFFSEIRDYSSTITLTQKYKLEENCQSEGTCIWLNRNKKLFPLCHNFLDLKYHKIHEDQRHQRSRKGRKRPENGVTCTTMCWSFWRLYWLFTWINGILLVQRTFTYHGNLIGKSRITYL